jgi:YidC/Oxa1 family membrane protein insertase
MGFDRNTVIGFVLIGALLVAMLVMNNRSQTVYQAEQKRIADSAALAKAKAAPVVDSNKVKQELAKADSAKKTQSAGDFQKYLQGSKQEAVLENELVKITFTNKGAQPETVELKTYKKFDGTPLVLRSGTANKLSYSFATGNNVTGHSADLFFAAGNKQTAADGSQSLTFSMADSAGKSIQHIYTLYPGQYMLDFDLKLGGADKLFSKNMLDLQWQTEAPQAEKDIAYEKQQVNICYVENGDYDFEHPGSGGDKKFSKPVDWLSVKQQFFASTLIAKNKFQSAEITWKVPDDSAKAVVTTDASCKINVPNGSDATIAMQLYYGPSDYNVLKKYGNQLQNIVPYGSGMFSFVKYINRHFLLPVWDFLRSNIASYGIIILLLTLFIRLLTSPILYKSYLSGAKMKVLKPEIDALKAKFKDDQQAFSMEQMKLWKSAGVSPLGGCLPALLQIPIFMSLYYFFQSNISLRGQSFLWAKDLAAYDSIATLPFSIPFYGDHVSLFTLTATITSLLISLYSMSNMQDNSNPVMKYMPYIFPVLLLGVFNNLPAALTWYYTISNLITLLLQFVIQKYIINHDKLKAQIEENKKKPVKTSGWQQKMQEMQEKNKQLQASRTKTGKK